MDTFIAIAGATELLSGLLVISGALPQVAGIPFNAPLLLFGQTGLLDHLPVYGVFLTLLAYGSNARTAPLVRWLPAVRRAAAAPDGAGPVTQVDRSGPVRAGSR